MIQGDENGVVFKDWAYQEWLSKYGVKPPWGVKDWANLQRALERFDDPGAAREAWKVYLTNKEPFFKGHSPSKFLFDIGRFAVQTVKVAPKPKDELQLRLERMAAISAEVDRDPTIPEAERKNEYKRRWGMEA